MIDYKQIYQTIEEIEDKKKLIKVLNSIQKVLGRVTAVSEFPPGFACIEALSENFRFFG